MTHVCIICKERIVVEKERWVRLTDFDKKQLVKEVFYHLECWRNRFRIDNSIRKQKMYKQTQDALGNIGKMIQQINPNQNHKQVYEISEIR